VTHEEVLSMGKQKSEVMRALVERIVELAQINANVL
jgi:purine nucleoside phosphorylase